MSHYERLIKDYEALTRTLHHEFANAEFMLEYLDEELEELEEEMDLSLN
jgi:hypothetical protein